MHLPVGLLLLSCLHREPANPVDGPPPLFVHMVEHYASLTAARDAVVRGDLDAVSEELVWLASHEPSADLGAGSTTMITSMRLEALGILAATTPSEAGRAVARTAAWCGRCHSQMGVRLQVDDTAAPGGDAVIAHMMRHRWVIDRLWEGLVAPSDEAWRRGAAAMAEDLAVTSSEVPHAPGRDAAVDVIARYVHESGWSAEEAVTSEDRARVYGDLLAACADCHAETRAGRPTP